VSKLTIARAWELLDEVKDPEVPVISVVDLGIVRDLRYVGDCLEVVVTPTYSGCPALKVIESSIAEHLLANGVAKVEIKNIFAPPWTTDWITETGRAALKAYGIAPPGAAAIEQLVPFPRRPEPIIPCPFCNSASTQRRSQFGSTACKALYFCDGCNQPFEYFKAI